MQTKDILKELRKSKGFSTMQEFCNASNISFSTYQNYESGKRLPTAEFLMQIADFYGVTTDYLLGREEPKGEDIFNMLPIDDYSKTVVRVYAALSPKERQNFVDAVRKIANGAELILKEPEEKQQPVLEDCGTIGEELERRQKEADAEAEALRKDTA